MIDVIVAIIVLMVLLVVCMQVFTVFLQKQQLQAYAAELAREIELCGAIDASTTAFQKQLDEKFHFAPEVTYSKRGLLPLGQTFQITAKLQGELGLFAGFGSFTVPLIATVEGKSEVYRK